jgi:hypothetical protein
LEELRTPIPPTIAVGTMLVLVLLLLLLLLLVVVVVAALLLLLLLLVVVMIPCGSLSNVRTIRLFFLGGRCKHWCWSGLVTRVCQ